MLNWNTSREDTVKAVEVARRAVTMAKELGVEYDQMTALMDIEACHNNGNPLKFQELLEADNFNFGHDVFGIRSNLNRETGQLENCFVPRYSA